jgi:hypothetical protein
MWRLSWDGGSGGSGLPIGGKVVLFIEIVLGYPGSRPAISTWFSSVACKIPELKMYYCRTGLA